MSYIEHKYQYLSIMHQFLNNTLSPQAFESMYFAMWRQDRDEEWKIIEQWDRRYDLELHEEFASGKISETEFNRGWNTLFKSQSTKKRTYINVLNSVFTAIDVYVEAPHEPWQIDQTELMRVVQQAIEDIENLSISQSDDY